MTITTLFYLMENICIDFLLQLCDWSPCKPPSLTWFQSNLLVWVPALSPDRSSQLHQQCLIGHFNLGRFSLFFLSHYFQLLYHNHPSHFTATHPSPPHSSQSNTKDRQRGSFLIKFYFILPHLYFSFSWPAEVCLMSIDVDTIVRISQNTKGNQAFCLTLKRNSWSHCPFPLMASVGEGLVVSRWSWRGHWKPDAWRNKPLKCSLSLYISSLILTLQAAEQKGHERTLTAT